MSTLLRLGPCVADLAARTVTRPDGAVALAPREAAVLALLAAEAGRTVSRDRLLAAVWGYRGNASTRAVDMTFSRLRQKVELDPLRPRFLVTIHGEGYRLERVEAPASEPAAVAPAAARLALPAERSPFVGRAAEVERVLAWMGGEEARWLTIVGPGGVGKSRLAREVGRRAEERAAARFVDGATWVDLTAAGDDDAVPGVLARALGVDLAQNAPPWRLLARALAGRRTLLLVDNAEHVRAGLAPLLGVVVGEPGLRVVATSRAPLGDLGETTLRLGGLPDDDAATLLRALAARAGATVADDAGLCAPLGGLPLAVELVAGALAHAPEAEVRARVERAPVDLHDGARSPRHRSIRQLFALSWAPLPAPERAAAAAISVFPGAFDEDAATRVAGASSEVLDALVDRGLLVPGGPGRWRMHPLLRALATEQRAGDPGPARRHRAWALGLLVEGMAHPDLRGIARLDALAADLHAAWTDAVACLDVEALDAAGAPLADLCAFTGRVSDAVRLFAVAAARLFAAGHPDRAGRMAAREARARVAAGDATGALARLDEIGGDGAEAWHARAQAHLDRGAYDAAEAAAAAAVARAGDDTPTAVRALVVLADAAWSRGRPAEGEAPATRALALARGTALERSSLHTLATVAYERGRHDEALALFREAQALAARTGEATGEAYAATGAANVLRVRGDLAAADALYAEANARFLRAGHVLRLGRNLHGRALVARQRGRYEEAAALMAESVACARRSADPRGARDATMGLGTIAIVRGRPEDAVAPLVSALADNAALGDPAGEANLLANLAIATWMLGRREEALAWAARLHALAEPRDPGPARVAWLAVAAMVAGAFGERDARLRLADLLGTPSESPTYPYVLLGAVHALVDHAPPAAARLAVVAERRIPAHHPYRAHLDRALARLPDRPAAVDDEAAVHAEADAVLRT